MSESILVGIEWILAGIEECAAMANFDLVSATVVNGQIVYREGEFARGFGAELRAGRFLQAANP